MDLKIKANSRQIPKEQTICGNKKYYDVLYAYLQLISAREEDGFRYVYEKDVNFSEWADKFGTTRQTISAKFKNMCGDDLNLITVSEDGMKYRLNVLNNNQAMLIPYHTLRAIHHGLSERAISTYAYMFNRFYANDCKEFYFTLTQVKAHLGLSQASKNNNDVITDILMILRKLGLIGYKKENVVMDDTHFGNIKTLYKIEWVTNEIS